MNERVIEQMCAECACYSERTWRDNENHPETFLSACAAAFDANSTSRHQGKRATMSLVQPSPPHEQCTAIANLEALPRGRPETSDWLMHRRRALNPYKRTLRAYAESWNNPEMRQSFNGRPQEVKCCVHNSTSTLVNAPCSL